MKVPDPDDTIAAVSTPSGEGGIGIIRISGPRALPLALKTYKPKKNKKKFLSHRLYLGDLIDSDSGETIDECLMAYMKSPHSFTKEDTVELQCHGGTVVLQSAMELLLKSGIRQAEPGEFTRRAFLNGRIDLPQAESIIDIIRARTDRSLRLAQVHLKGGLKEALNAIKENLLKSLALLEAYIDFPEEEIEESAFSNINSNIEKSIEAMATLLNTYEEGRILREGIHVVIAGRPNVGKSSLLNALLEEKRAIVTSVPGTTRDIIEEAVNIRGIPVNLIDTAGIRETEDVVESEGVKRAREKLLEADIVLYMVDNEGVDESDLDTIRNLMGDRKIIVINKIDLLSKKALEEIKARVPEISTASISLKEKRGIEGLKESLYEAMMRHKTDITPSVVISRKRQKVALHSAIRSLEEAKKGLETSSPYELITIDIKAALADIAEVAGETTTEDVLEKIFSDFCIGK